MHVEGKGRFHEAVKYVFTLRCINITRYRTAQHETNFRHDANFNLTVKKHIFLS